MYFLCLQVPECFNVVLKKIKKVEMDRDILLPHSDNIERFLKKMS